MPHAKAKTNTSQTGNKVADSSTAFLGVKLSSEMKERLKKAASHQERTISAFARYHLSKAADKTLIHN
jgi:predicted DNA-binding protein